VIQSTAGLAAAGLVRTPDLNITRVKLDNHDREARLIIDFQAFTTGRIALPPIRIGPYHFDHLEIHIASILGKDRRNLQLSGPLSALPAPGTDLLIYGTIIAIALGILALTLGLYWEKRSFSSLKQRLRRRRALRGMQRCLRLLRGLLTREGRLTANGNLPDNSEGAALRQILAKLSREFRVDLGAISGLHCSAMTSREFLDFPVLGKDNLLKGSFLAHLFERCDNLRFSGVPVEKSQVAVLLDDFDSFTRALIRTGETRDRGGRT
jgi:hypothetical protein